MEFTKEKKSEKKIYPILDFLKVKYHINRKKEKKRKDKSLHTTHYTVHTLNINYYFKYL